MKFTCLYADTTYFPSAYVFLGIERMYADVASSILANNVQRISIPSNPDGLEFCVLRSTKGARKYPKT